MLLKMGGDGMIPHLSLCVCSSKLKTHHTSEIGANLQHKEKEEPHIRKNFMFDMRAPYTVVC
jgi:hypothetical protein